MDERLGRFNAIGIRVRIALGIEISFVCCGSAWVCAAYTCEHTQSFRVSES